MSYDIYCHITTCCDGPGLRSLEGQKLGDSEEIERQQVCKRWVSQSEQSKIDGPATPVAIAFP